ncbi:MAG: WG repeat-containing protein, partial [Ruthenibacterium sp.]
MKQIRGTVAMLLAVAMVASMAACGTTKPTSAAASGSDATAVSSTPTQEAVPPVQTLAVGDWVIEPTVEAQYITGMGEFNNERFAQSVYSHLAICKQEDDWQYLNALTGRSFGKVWNIETFGDTLFGWDMDDSTMPYEARSALFAVLDDALFAEESVRMDEGGHDGGYFNMAVADGKLGLIEIGPCFSAFDNDPEYYGYAPGPAYAVLLLDVHNGDWEKETYDTGGESWWFQGGTLNDTGAVVVVDKSGTLLSDTVYEDYFPFHEGVAAMKLNGKWGYVNEQGVAITDFVYEPLMVEEVWNDDLADYDGTVERRHPYSANEGMIPVKRDGLCGVIDIKGKEVIPCKYEDIASVYGGRVWAKENGKWGVLNLTKNAELSTEETARITEELHCGKKSANIYDWRYESQLFSEA